MPTIDITQTRLLQKDEPIPYKLLMLADEEMQAIERYIHQSDVYVVENNNEVIGVYVIYPVDSYTAEIKAIAVDEAWQNHGIGKSMIRDAETRSREKGLKEILIGTPTIASKQIQIYQKAGFELFDVRKNFFLTFYMNPIFEDGVQIRDMAMLKKKLGD
jgi:N-acetylglutamate synthase-like GNAT family acetyltransferase